MPGNGGAVGTATLRWPEGGLRSDDDVTAALPTATADMKTANAMNALVEIRFSVNILVRRFQGDRVP
ncbi:MAG TPA: hypothetical protein VGC72_07515 [Candidatus Elarobacter sp.]